MELWQLYLAWDMSEERNRMDLLEQHPTAVHVIFSFIAKSDTRVCFLLYTKTLHRLTCTLDQASHAVLSHSAN